MKTRRSMGNEVALAEGDWTLELAQGPIAKLGWRSVIKHNCDKIGAPYWMLIERHTADSICMYCSKDIPTTIVTLFKLMNSEVMK